MLVTVLTVFALTCGSAVSLRILLDGGIRLIARQTTENERKGWQAAAEALKTTVEALEVRIKSLESVASRVESLESKVEDLHAKAELDQGLIRRLRLQRDRLLRILRKMSTRLAEVEETLKKITEKNNASSN